MDSRGRRRNLEFDGTYVLYLVPFAEAIVRDQVRSDPEFWKPFLTVLNALCARQDAVALAIQLEVARSSAEVGAKN